MKIAITTSYFPNYEPLAQLVLPNWREYCARWGYDLVINVGAYKLSNDVHWGFHREKHACDTLFDGGYDLIACLDLDVLITNQTIPVESFIAGYDQYSYFATADINGYNNGIFLAKNSSGARAVFEHVLSAIGRKSNEQDPIKHEMDLPVIKDNVAVIPHPSFNSYDYTLYPDYAHHAATNPGQWKPGHFILHLPGLSLQKRLDVFSFSAIIDSIVK